jgi:hypothetical protein
VRDELGQQGHRPTHAVNSERAAPAEIDYSGGHETDQNAKTGEA